MWLRKQIKIDLNRWRGREAAYAPHVVREGEYWWHEAREHADRCEALLAILDEHYILVRDNQNEAYEEFSVVKIGGADRDRGCVTCHYYGQGGVKGYGRCRTVRLLAAAYQHREGFQMEWVA